MSLITMSTQLLLHFMSYALLTYLVLLTFLLPLGIPGNGRRYTPFLIGSSLFGDYVLSPDHVLVIMSGLLLSLHDMSGHILRTPF